MIDTKYLEKFYEIRVLLFCQSPQVKEHDNHIVTLDEHGKIDSVAAILTAPESFFILSEMIHASPLSVEIAEVPPHPTPVIRDKAVPTRQLAFMLPQ